MAYAWHMHCMSDSVRQSGFAAGHQASKITAAAFTDAVAWHEARAVTTYLPEVRKADRKISAA